MKIKFDVSAQELAIIQDVLKNTLPAHCKVWVFGSRAKHQAKFNSDLDLAIEHKTPLDNKTLMTLQEAFDEAPLAYSVDIAELNFVEDYFREIIDSHKVELPLNAMVPELRFSGFDSRWVTQSISSLVAEGIIDKPLDGNHGNIHPKASDYVSSGIPFVMANDIVNGEIDYSNCSHITKEQADSLQKGFSVKGDVLLTHKGTVGEVAVVGEISTPYIMLTPQVTYYRVKNSSKLSNTFLSKLFVSEQFQKPLHISADSGTRPYIGIIEQGKLKINYPETVQEQQKIASFLSAVDKKINQLRRKRDALQSYKRGVMQKIFSQEIRFTQDDGAAFLDWEDKKIKDLFTSRKGKGLSKELLTENGKRKCVLYGELYTTYSEIIEEVLSSTNSEEGVVSEAGDILIPCSTTTTGIDLADATVIEEDGVLLGGDISVLRVKNDGCSRFFAYYLTHYKKHELAKYGQGSTIVHLYFDHFKIIDMCCPSDVNEQVKISEFIYSIDKKIDHVNQQITQTDTFKKGLLQKMFV